MSILIWPGVAVAITAMLTLAALRAWRGWLELKRYELTSARSGPEAQPPSGIRIELAAMRERLRKLEEIAQGVDL